MPRIKIELPPVFDFTTEIPVRITDLNYGGHVGNDSILSMIHEARIQFLSQYGYSEMNFSGVGMIMSDVAIEFKTELFYGEKIKVSVAIVFNSKITFELFYKLEKLVEGNPILVAAAKTGMVCYDYKEKKITSIPEQIRLLFQI